MAKQTELGRVREAIGTAADAIGRTKKGTFVARRTFFYRHGCNETMFQAQIEGRLKAAGLTYQVVEAYEHWAPFNGGASVARSSHWGVEFTVIS